MKIISAYFFVEKNDNDINRIRQLSCASINERIQFRLLPTEAPCLILDGVLGLEINPSSLSRKFWHEPSLITIDEKVEQVVRKLLQTRTAIYSKSIAPLKLLFNDNKLLVPFEREFFLILKLQEWIKEKLQDKPTIVSSKKNWLITAKRYSNIFNRALSSPTDYKHPILYYLQELYNTYSLDEEMFSVGHALERLSLPGIQVFKKMYDLGISDDEYSVRALDLEIGFRTQFLKTAYASLESRRLPDNTKDLEATFSAFYLHVVKGTLIKTLQKRPDLQKSFSQIPAESSFWEETTLNKSWWDFIVKTLNPQICVYTLSPTPQTSEQ